MLIFDLETDGLLPDVTKIHCFTIHDTSDDSYTRYDPMNQDIRIGVDRLMQADCLCGHNVIGYDLPVIEKLYGFKYQGEVVDTLIWAMLTYSNIKSGDFGRWKRGELPGNLIGSHSLEAYGYRLGELKGTFSKTTDWQAWTPSMSDYCEQDVRVTRKLYDRLEYKGQALDALQTEQRVMEIITRQEQHGFLFDVEKAEALYTDLMPIRDRLKAELQEIFPPVYVKKENKLFTPKRDNKTLGYVAGAPMQKIKLQEFNPNSGTQIVKRLKQKYQWEPTEFTDKGNPKVDEETLKLLPYDEIPALLEYMMVEKRISQLAEGDKAWLKMYTPLDSRIHGSVRTIGCATFRMSHNNPNVAQVPAVYVPYGDRCRDLFIVPEGFTLVGCDASGLEMRCLAHYLALYDDGAYVKACTEGNSEDGTDAHTMNAKAIGRSRNEAKTFFYGMIYGAGDALLGQGDPKLGKRLRNRLLNGIVGFKQLMAAIDHSWKTKRYVKAIDGRLVWLKNQHSALNFLLQSCGAIIMKKALEICDNDLRAAGIREHMEFVANVHDEFQMECRTEYAEQVGDIARQSIVKAGEYFDFRCPLDGEFKCGASWKETH